MSQKPNLETSNRSDYLLLFCLGIALSAVWYRNFEICQIDSSQTLTFMNMFRDPTLYPSSFLFTQAYPYHFYSFYYLLAGLLGKVLDPYWALYLLFVLINCFCIMSLFRFAFAVTQNKMASYLSVFALTLQWQWWNALGGSAALGTGPFPDQLATAFLLLAITCFLRNQPVKAFSWVGFTFNIHPSFSLFVFVMFITSVILQKRWHDLWKGCCIGALLALPEFLYMTTHPLPHGAPFAFQDWYQMVRIRISDHTMPFSWPLGSYAMFAPYPLLFLLGYKDSVIHRRLLHFSFAILALCIIGTIFSEWIPLATVIKLTLFRSTRFFIIMAVVLFMNLFDEATATKNLFSIAFVFLSAALIAANLPAIYIGLIFFGGQCFGQRFLKLKRATSLFVLLLLASPFFLKIPHTKLLFFTLVLSILTAGIFLSRILHWNQKKIVPVMTLLLSLSTLLSPTIYGDESRSGYYSAAKDLQIWLRNSTPRDSMFFLPPDAGGWSGISMRGDFLNFYEVSYPLYAPYMMQEVTRRAQEYLERPFNVKNDKDLLDQMVLSYQQWSEEKFRYMAKKWGCQYAVVKGQRTLAFPLLYQNSHFRVYEIVQ